MKQRIADLDGEFLTISVNDEEREPWQRPNTRPGVIYVNDGSGEYPPLEFNATSARALAAALLRAADEAEGVRPGGALERTSAILEHQYDPDEYADDPSLLPQVHAEALKIVRDVRNEVAAFIRSNIDMQGRDFPDAESVAVWLEEGR